MKITRPIFSLKTRLALIFFIATFTFYTLMSYGGIRESDSEVVLRTAESLANEGTFAVSNELETWKGFGLRQGRGGRKYSFYGPAEAIMLVPVIKLAQLINRSKWYDKYEKSIPISFYAGNGLQQFMFGVRPQNIEPHALRFIVSFFNILVCSISVVMFLLLLEKLTHSIISAGFVTVLFAFGTLMLNYSGTLFSEMLAMLFALISFYFLVKIEPICSAGACPPLVQLGMDSRACPPQNQPGINPGATEFPVSRYETNLLISGTFLGLAVTTHVTSILFTLFFFIYAVYPSVKNKFDLKTFIRYSIFFGFGLLMLLALLGYFNYMRFGDIFETGRTGDPEDIHWIVPWDGARWLLFGGGKGLLWFCPAVIAGVLFWGYFHKSKPVLSITVLSTALFRIAFLGSRSNWHAGFGLGPRYLVALIPFLLIPAGYFVRDALEGNKLSQLKIFCGFTLFCISQQIYFSLGEIFSFSHIVKMNLMRMGINPFKDNLIYLDWNISPLSYLLEGKLGPFLLQHQPLNHYVLLLLCVAAGAGLTCALFVYLLGCYRKSSRSSSADL